VSENRVARLMREHGIKARVATMRYSNPSMRRYYACLCQRQPNFPRFGNSIFPTRLRTVVFV